MSRAAACKPEQPRLSHRCPERILILLYASMALRGCWTCKDRRVACDRRAPSCLKCEKSKRKCAGYGTRFTWQTECPAVLDQKRLENRVRSYKGEYYWINAVPTDVRLSKIIDYSIEIGGAVEENLVLPSAPGSSSLHSKKSLSDEAALLQYFRDVVVDLLPTVDVDRARLGEYLVELASSRHNHCSRAVYHSILALASYHRGSNIIEAERFKSSALKDLLVQDRSDLQDEIAHIAANLLLCVVEMQQTLPRNSCWIGYICGVRKIVDAVNEASPAPGSRESLVLNWLYFYDVMARVVIRHWRTAQVEAIAKGLRFDSKGEDSCIVQYILARASFAQPRPDLAAHVHPIMQLIGEVTDVLMYSSDSTYHSTKYHLHTNNLRSKLLTESSSPRDSSVAVSRASSVHELELLRLAGLIYLERISRDFSGHSAELVSWTRKALLILAKVDLWPCAFALLVIGCEADLDDERLTVLKFFARMEKQPHLRTFNMTRSLIQTAWNQRDLAGEGQFQYLRNINLTISLREVPPALV